MPSSETPLLPSPADVRTAITRIAESVRRTPLLESAWLNSDVQGRVLFKPESLQLTGSFKLRGALNRTFAMSPDERRRGIVAWSAGNHAQALARAGHQLRIPVTIAMPSDAPAVKVENTRRWGAQVVFYDRQTEDREAIGHQLAAESGAVIVPPYDDPWVIAGQGTAGLEAFEDAVALGAVPDRFVAPAGGGGLIAGCALAASATNLNVDIYSAEPEGHDCLRRSLVAGRIIEVSGTSASIADALLVRRTGQLTFQLNRDRIAGGFAVSERHIADAVRFAFTELRLVVEPGGAAALGAVLANLEEFTGKTTIVLLSGANVDPELFASILELAA